MIPRVYYLLSAHSPAIDATAKVNYTKIGTVSPIVPPPHYRASSFDTMRCNVCGSILVAHDEGLVCPRCGTVYSVPTVEALMEGKGDRVPSRKAVFEHDHAEWYVVFKVILEDPYLANRYKHEAENMFRKIVRHINRLPRKERIPFLHYFVLTAYLVLSKSSRVEIKGKALFDKVYYAFNLMRPPFPILRHVRIKKEDLVKSAKKLAMYAPEKWMREELSKIVEEELNIFEKL